MGKLFKWILPESIIQAATSTWAQVYFWPLLWTAAVTIAGLLQGVPVMWIMVAATLTIAAAFTGALRFTEWQYNRRVEGKLLFSAPRILRSHSGGKEIGLGVTLQNSAQFPIKCNISGIKTKRLVLVIVSQRRDNSKKLNLQFRQMALDGLMIILSHLEKHPMMGCLREELKLH